MNDPDNAIERIVDFLQTYRTTPPPDFALHEAKRSILNILGASVGAVDSLPIAIMRRWAQGMGDAPRHPVLWTGERLAADRAALINAAAMHVLDFNDTHIPTHAHAGAPVVAAALSVATATTSGADLLRAILLGMEVHFAVAAAIMPSHFRRGFHITVSGGAIGAAAACAVLLGLDRDATAQAVAAATLQAPGLREGLTTMSNAYGVGNAARGGVAAALLAAQGLTSAVTAIDGPEGLRQATSAAEPEAAAAAFANLGKDWTIRENSYKFHPTETISQAAVEGILRLREPFGDTPPELDRIELVNAPLVAEVVAKRTARLVPDDTLKRTFDTKFCTASAWLRAGFGPTNLMPSPAEAEAVMALRERISVVANSDYRVEHARVTIVLADGTRQSCFVDGYVGSAATPMTDRQIEEKLARAAQGTPFAARAAEISRMVWDIENTPVASLMAQVVL